MNTLSVPCPFTKGYQADVTFSQVLAGTIKEAGPDLRVVSRDSSLLNLK